MAKCDPIDPGLVVEDNARREGSLCSDYAHLGEQLSRRNIEIETITARVRALEIAVPTWGVGTGGTRFARFPGPGEPRSIYEKLDDCKVINRLVREGSGVRDRVARSTERRSYEKRNPV